MLQQCVENPASSSYKTSHISDNAIMRFAPLAQFMGRPHGVSLMAVLHLHAPPAGSCRNRVPPLPVSEFACGRNEFDPSLSRTLVVFCPHLLLHLLPSCFTSNRGGEAAAHTHSAGGRQHLRVPQLVLRIRGTPERAFRNNAHPT